MNALRQEQQLMLGLIETAKPDAVALLEAGTGTGKTRIGCIWALKGEHPTLVAVPTLNVGQQWVRELQALDPTANFQPVWGQGHYDNPQDQQIALHAARSSRLVLCSHHMLPALLAMRSWRLLVDEAHMLPDAIRSRSGEWAPASGFGAWFNDWCMAQMLVAGQSADIPLAGRMRALVIKRMKAQTEAQVAVAMDASGELGISIRTSEQVQDAFDTLWRGVTEALLLSATLTTTSYSGYASHRLMAKRLRIPAARVQFLGRVKAPWRDAGVTVLLPSRHVTQEDWLCPHAARKETWAEEVAQTIQHMNQDLKTLMLLTSYADVQAVALALKAQKVKGVIADERGVGREHMLRAFAQKQTWCWLATGSAWTGFDSPVPMQRLALAKLPLPAPAATRDLESLTLSQMDSVFRFRQGLGRLVRSAEQGVEKEVVVLDGRINGGSWWRGICQPYLQVLSEDYEVHKRFVQKA